ncbi:MAG: alpha/beta hydrolase [Erysipelotrichaceae bacterium]|nr:alpha/beta hydrolase [Erysipelotrichaceae bacterium]
MKFYTYGNQRNPSIMLIPGTCCHHSMFDHVIEGLTESFYVIVVSYSGFDETDDSIYISQNNEITAIEDYVTILLQGHVTCVYGSSLGGSLVADLVQRQVIRIDHAIIGSSDMDKMAPQAAKLQSIASAKLLYPIIDTGILPSWMKKVNDIKISRHPEIRQYRETFMKLFMPKQLRHGVVKLESIEHQIYSDLVTPIQKGIDSPYTTIHVFYATKMGPKYEKRYHKYFARPEIRFFDFYHEELLICFPEKWLEEVKDCCR